MPPKLRGDKEESTHNRLSLRDETWAKGPGFAPHILYANLQFDSVGKNREIKRFVDWCREVGPDWNDKRILKYLAGHQSEFRECLRWLMEDAIVDLEDWREELGKDIEHLGDDVMLDEWRSRSGAKFLQRHGVSHAGVSVRPRITPAESGVLCFWGIDLGPRKPKDPLDMICWHLLHLLQRDGSVNIRQCRYCERMFKPRTKRKRYCSDLCRAKDHAKSREEWRDYMRKYRAVRKHMKEITTTNPANSEK